MLVLGRKPGEYVMIDNKIKVKVIRSSEGDLRLAIDAPKEINVVRGELYEEQQRLKKKNE
jgi:carbon storage regulator